MYDDGRHRYDAAYGQTARVAHEDLGREGVVPQISYQGSDESRQKHHHLLAAGHEHQVEMPRQHSITGDVGEHSQRQPYYRRVARRHAVQAIVEVRAIRHRRHDECREEHKENPAQTVFPLVAGPAEEVGVVEVVTLKERYGGTRRFHVG